MPDELILSIEKLIYGGDGLAHADGNTVFVPYVLPGEEVRANARNATSSRSKGLRQLQQTIRRRFASPSKRAYMIYLFRSRRTDNIKSVTYPNRARAAQTIGRMQKRAVLASKAYYVND